MKELLLQSKNFFRFILKESTLVGSGTLRSFFIFSLQEALTLEAVPVGLEFAAQKVLAVDQQQTSTTPTLPALGPAHPAPLRCVKQNKICSENKRKVVEMFLYRFAKVAQIFATSAWTLTAL